MEGGGGGGVCCSYLSVAGVCFGACGVGCRDVVIGKVGLDGSCDWAIGAGKW